MVVTATPGILTKEREKQIEEGAKKLTHAYPTVPTLLKWKEDSYVGNVLGPSRAADPTLVAIDRLLGDYWAATFAGAKAFFLAELFFATMSWVNSYKVDVRMDPRRRPAILSLNLCVANKLAQMLEVTVGQLAGQLHADFGIEMSDYGKRVDEKEKPKYLDPARRERFRILFRKGLAYRFEEGATAETKLTPMDTIDSLSGKDFEDKEGRAGEGFVMSMSGELFVAPLGEVVLYHSSFMGGRPVLCAGKISARHGQITRIRNDSGHYRPVDDALATVLRRLQWAGVNLTRITVEQEQKNGKAMRGDRFLIANGNWSMAGQGVIGGVGD